MAVLVWQLFFLDVYRAQLCADDVRLCLLFRKETQIGRVYRSGLFRHVRSYSFAGIFRAVNCGAFERVITAGRRAFGFPTIRAVLFL